MECRGCRLPAWMVVDGLLMKMIEVESGRVGQLRASYEVHGTT